MYFKYVTNMLQQKDAPICIHYTTINTTVFMVQLFTTKRK